VEYGRDCAEAQYIAVPSARMISFVGDSASINSELP